MVAITGKFHREFVPTAPSLTRRVPARTHIELELNRYLIQGANPFDTSTHQKHKDFQGGFRCTILVIGQPAHGTISVAPSLTGLLWTPTTPGWFGLDSFAWALKSSSGQISDASCFFLKVGI